MWLHKGNPLEFNQWLNVLSTYSQVTEVSPLPRCATAMSDNLQMCIVVEKWTWSQFWGVATRTDDWNDQIFYTDKKRLCGEEFKTRTNWFKNIHAHSSSRQYIISWRNNWQTRKHMGSLRLLRILRHYEGVLSRLPQHPVDIERRGGEAIFVPVSALIKTQPEGQSNGWVTDRLAGNRAAFSSRDSAGKAVLVPVLKIEHSL